ncbi:hypothetical protein SAMN04487880_3643 [Marinobacter sp. es.042]|uniref:hypothetical protein n=1 Tax=Marinobacter sp. es.042 TaxID=1761794 RepID=UPI000B505185|nr:hypothetical protein [Marinobacter sp. es.042]SNB53795.1 hypothetical protein SAMN04487880_0011 [Marinobacter sp. es.042]SNB59574.1 hypothetical protein SAMN04487880_3643 [Marinobacter sp. es.042]
MRLSILAFVTLLLTLGSVQTQAATSVWHQQFYLDQCNKVPSQSESWSSAQSFIDSDAACSATNGYACYIEITDNATQHCTGTSRGTMRVFQQACTQLSHEGGVPEGTACGQCGTGHVPDPSGESGFDCRLEKTFEECRYNFMSYDPRQKKCVTECIYGELDYRCNAEPFDECTSEADDFVGTIGWGANRRNVCSGDNQCADNETFAFGEGPDGAYTGQCVNNDANPPICPDGFKGGLIITEDGFACASLNPDGTNENDTSNGDSDGDGEGDLTGMAGQLDDIKGLLSSGNTERGNIKNQLDGIGKSIKDGTQAITDAIGNIPGGGGGGSGNGDGNSQTEIVGEDGESITWSGEAIPLELADGLDELNAVQGEYETLIANIRAEMSASFGSFTGAGGLQDNNITLYGETFNAGLSKFGADLSILGSIILFAATFIALGIIMGARD